MSLDVRIRVLRLLLRLSGLVTVSAFLAMLLPIDWMAATHRWLGLGEFPNSPVVEYLARSIAALYGFHGGLLLLISADPLKHLSIVKYVAFMYIACGPIVFAIDLEAQMPMWWTLMEGPPIAMLGIVMASLARDDGRAIV